MIIFTGGFILLISARVRAASTLHVWIADYSNEHLKAGQPFAKLRDKPGIRQ
jgi:hypothetical protein